MADTDLVSPITPQVPPQSQAAPAPAEEAPPEDSPAQAKSLPDELLRLPGMMALISGAPPALSLRIKDKDNRDDVKLISQHKDALQQAGFGLYRSLSGEFGVLFNQLFVHGADIQAADKMGKLEEIAPPADAITHAVGKSGLQNPALSGQARPTGFATQKSVGAPQSATGTLPQPQISASPASGSAQNKTQSARLKNMVVGGPTTGQAPGAGRILNTILKPVV